MYIVFVLTLLGFLLLMVEILLPSVILGSMGISALVVAIALGYLWYGPVLGSWVLAGVGAFCSVGFLLWLRAFSHTLIGQCMINQESLSSFLTNNSHLIGAQGVALSILRPAGIALIEGKRRDVVTNGFFVAAGMPVTVVAEDRNTLVVQALTQSQSQHPNPNSHLPA